jgi:hypothetical protein
MPVNLLSDVDVVAISLVDKAANKKRIYLKKSENDLLDLPAPHRLIKNDDWSVFYAVVAEPEWRENPGKGSPGETFEDIWASEDEIRKAAHRFMQNGALVNKMHETLDPYGTVVENFIAQADFEVEGETIKKGSWVVGIATSEEGRKAIDDGTLAGISIQGSGVRVLDVTKTHAGENPAGPIRHLISYYKKFKHPFTKCVRDNRKRFGPRTEAVCAGLKDISTQTHNWRNSGKLAKSDNPDLIPVGLLDEAVEIWKSHGLTAEDATMALESMQENTDKNILEKFADFLKGEVEEQEETVTESKTTEITSADERLEKAAENLEKSTRAIESLANNLGAVAQKLVEGTKTQKDEEEEDEGEEITKRFDEFETSLGSLREAVEKLAQGDSTQPDKDKVEKSDKDPLAGLLFD